MSDADDGNVAVDLAYNARMYETGGRSWGQWVGDMAAANDIHDLTESDIDEFLWEHTAWPLAEIDHVRRQILALFADWKEKPRDR